MKNKTSPFAVLFSKTDELLEQGSVIIAIDGGSGSGKTSLGKMFEEKYDCTVFHTDDFFLRPEQRTAERFSEAGGNFDRERFLEEILIPLSKGKNIIFSKFDCSEMKLLEKETVVPKKFCIVEGAYSLHPDLADFYDLKVFLDVSDDIQKNRIHKRNTPQQAEQFFKKWIPLENYYFDTTGIKSRSDLIIEIK